MLQEKAETDVLEPLKLQNFLRPNQGGGSQEKVTKFYLHASFFFVLTPLFES